MKPFCLAILLSLPLAAPAFGQTADYLEQSSGKGAAPAQMTLPLNGRVYTGLEFIGTNGETVTFESKEGPVTAKWSDLPKNVQDYFARAYEDSLKDQQAAAINDLTAPVKISGKIVEKLPQGVIVRWGDQLVLLTGLANAANPGSGNSISVTARRSGSFPGKAADGTSRVLQKFQATGP